MTSADLAPAFVEHYPPLTPATPANFRNRPAHTPIATRPTEPGSNPTHTLDGCPAAEGSSPCLCTEISR